MERCTWTIGRTQSNRPIPCREPALYEHRTVKLCDEHREAAVYGGFPWPLTRIEERKEA